ncbi:kinetochore-associated Ndc80 complex subunit ndc80 [Friedmanniomyces endolithicus]|nr:kinetochore-associated Ndc80 complex subunit ndc80 [Friedmanniomyces endolithicus]KAK0316364.1 kinetochore-associated Ndc80 complex subunit ndc80 [Friedmanniomyces endolithicus]
MSQESNLFSIRRPRETLGAVSHNASAIPMPASAMKRSTSQTNLHTTNHVRTTSASRMSLAPNRPAQPVFQRSSSGTNLADMFSTVQRPSTANFFNSTGGRKSYAPVASTPAHPIQLRDGSTTERRSSIYTARPSQGGFGPTGHQSFFATAPPQNAVPTDPRRLRELSTRTQMGNELLEFLSQRNFEMETKHQLAHKIVTNPIQKDFDTMFQFLYHCIDPSYRFQKKMDVEVPPLLKQLRYPFEKHISKSALGAVGGNNWSTFLGLLHWMMSLAKMMEQYSTGVYDEACIEAGFDVSADRITFEFLSDAYKEWLSMDEEDEGEEEAQQRRLQPHVERMAAKFDVANQANLEQVKQLEVESKALQEQIDELSKSAPKLAKLDETIKILEEDRAKFEAYNASMDAKVEKYANRADLLQQEIEKYEQELQEAEDERSELQRRVDEQGLSVQDIDRMNSERERLQKGVETTSLRLEESKDRASKKEAETGGKLDELESVVQRFNSLGYQVGIIPSHAANAEGHDYDLQLRINAGPDFSASQHGAPLETSDRLLADPASGYQPHQLLAHDLRATKKALQDLRKVVSERRNQMLEEDMVKMEMLDKTKEALDDKYAELEGLGHRARAAQEEFEGTREVVQAQHMASEAKVESLEKELGKMRKGVKESVEMMVGREMGVNLEYVFPMLGSLWDELGADFLAFRYEQLGIRAAALREDMHTELERMLNDVIKFKIHVQTSLEKHEGFVAQEVEREIEEQQQWAAEGGDEDVDEDVDMEELED